MKTLNSKTPLVIKHWVKGRLVRTHHMRSNEFFIGSSRQSRLRLASPSIAGVICSVARVGDTWTIIDLGSEPDLKLNGRPFVEHTMTAPTVLEVGDHKLELSLPKKRREIFKEDFKDVKKGERLLVVKWHGHVVDTIANEAEAAELEVLGSAHLEITKVYMPQVPKAGKEKLAIDPSLKRPLIGTLLTLAIFLAVLLGLPLPKQEEEVKPKDNVYTRMIYDSKVLTQKRKQLVSMGIRTPKGTGNGNGSISEGAKGPQSQAVKAVNSMRQAGLQSLIGRIAKNAGKSAKFMAVLAGTPTANAAVDHNQLGGFGNMPSGGAATGKSGIIGNGKGFKVGGIGTGGKGGGTGDYKAGSGLGTGSVGNGEVGLEDAESVVEGGLDKEVIAGIIREHLGQIRYCYERQLAANPDLYGKIKVRFSIDAEGAVDSQSVGQSTLKSAMVEECILRRIATWKFPKPRGGTKVLVSYPFLFKSVN